MMMMMMMMMTIIFIIVGSSSSRSIISKQSFQNTLQGKNNESHRSLIIQPRRTVPCKKHMLSIAIKHKIQP